MRRENASPTPLGPPSPAFAGAVSRPVLLDGKALETAQRFVVRPADEDNDSEENSDGDQEARDDEGEGGASSTSSDVSSQFGSGDGLSPPATELGAFEPDRIATAVFGDRRTARYRRFFRHAERGPISPWHDIPLAAGSSALAVRAMVTEVPSMTQEQQRMVTVERLNPIMAIMGDEEALDYGRPVPWN